MKSIIILLSTVFISLNAFAQDILFSKANLQTELERYMPVIQQQGLFSLVLKNPQLELLADQQRLSIRSQVVLSTALGTESQGWIKVDGKLRYKQLDYSFYVDDPRVTEFNFADLPPALQPQIQALAGDILASVITEQPIYTLSDQSMQEALAKMMLKSIIIKEDSVVAALSPF